MGFGREMSQNGGADELAVNGASQSTSVGTCTSLNPSSLLLSADTSVIDNLALDSGTDDEMSIEAKRILRLKKLEREKLQKLGKLIPIDTENEADIIELATSNSEAYALPMRPKEEISNLTTLYNVDSRPSFVSSMRSSVLYSSDADSSRPSIISEDIRRPSIISDDIRSRKSKVVGFGLVEETQFDQLPNEYEPVIQSSVDIMKPGTSGLQSSSRNRGSVTISSQNVSNVTKTRSDEDSLAESFTALKNALRDDKK